MGRDDKRAQGNSGVEGGAGNGFVHSPDWGGGFLGVHICCSLSNCML